jgi:acyl dehydratase
MRTFSSPGELVTAEGTRLGVSGYQTVSQHDIDVFAALTGDNQWLHVDPRRAAAGPYGRTIAHGMYTLALVVPMLAEVFAVEAELVLHKGFDRVRFGAPVHVGARLRLVADLRSAKPVARGYTEAVIGVALEVDGHDLPVCTTDLRLLYQEVVAWPLAS